MERERAVTAEAIAEHFGVTVPTVNRWVREHRIPCIRPTRKTVRFKLSEVECALSDDAVKNPNSEKTSHG